MKKILILQNKIMHYRKSLYNELCKDFDVTILHSGTVSVNKDDLYTEKIVKIKYLGPFVFQEEVLKYAKENNFDIVIAMFDLKWVMNILALYLKPKKVKFIWWGHGYGQNEIGNTIRTYLIHKADSLILYSDKKISRFIEDGIDKNKIFIAHNTFEIKNAELNPNIKRNSFLFVGRLQQRKKVDILIESFHKIVKDIDENITLKIIGSGKEEIFLQQLIKKLHLEKRVLLLGAITDDSILKSHYQSALAYVSPGAVGLGVLHSFAYGVPVVTGRFEHHGPELDDNIIEGYNGIIYNDETELSDILLQFIKDESYSYGLGEHAYQHFAEKRSIENMAQGFKDAICYSMEQ